MATQKQQDVEHEQILRDMLEQFRPVFENSPDGVYLYLDDRHKICNERMAAMFGLTSEEWSAVPNFLAGFVAEEDQELVAKNYQQHVAALTRPVTFRFRARRKDGSAFTAETEMIPMSWRGHPVAYHFVREVR
jgi:PAS domain S-box-containing protein